ncbi:MAG: ABC transporter permease [Dehalococcoidia bacterium]
MLKYVIQRLLIMIPSLVGVTALTFFGLRLMLPYDVIDKVLQDSVSNDPAIRQQLTEDLGLTGSLPEQYLRWLGVEWFWSGKEGVLQGELGKSLLSGRSIASELGRRVPVSFELGLWAQVSAIVVSVPLGVIAALRQDRWQDYGLRSAAILVNSVPAFWIAVLVITFGSLWFQWAPPIQYKYLTDDPIGHAKIMLLPAIIIGLTPSGSLVRLVRTQMLEVLRQDYVRTAQAKGLSEGRVVYGHALRNALIPIVTVIGVSLPNLIAGAIIFEQIFLLPGMGRYLIDAVNQLDYPVILGLNLIFAFLLMTSVLIVDLSYALLDPRIRLR